MKNTKRIISALLAAVMVLGLAGCGEKKPTEKPPLLDDITVDWNIEPVPDGAKTEKEMRELWKYKASLMMEGGSYYGDISTITMTSDRAVMEMEEDGFYVTPDTQETRPDGMRLTMLRAVDADYINHIEVQFFGMEDEDFDWSLIDRMKETVTIGDSDTIMGMTMNEVFEEYYITGSMIEWLKNSEEGYKFWYEEDQFWFIQYTEEYDPYKGIVSSLYISRNNGVVDETYSLYSPGKYVTALGYGRDRISEEGAAKLKAAAAEFIAQDTAQ